jgi:hypothetical protein
MHSDADGHGSGEGLTTPSDEEPAEARDLGPDGEHRAAAATASAAADTAGRSAPRSPAEAFVDLAQQIELARREVAHVFGFVRDVGSQLSQLTRSADEIQLAGADAAIRGIIRIDELVFRHLREWRATTPSVHELSLATVLDAALDGEFRTLGIERFEPTPGETPDLSRTVTIANQPTPVLKPWLRGRIAAVTARGYILTTGDITRIFKKAEVVIYRS